MWLCVAIVFSGIIYFYFGSFQSNLVALINPQEIPEKENESQLANTQSPLSQIKDGLKGLGASFWSLFNFISKDDDSQREIIKEYQKLQPRKLPLSK